MTKRKFAFDAIGVATPYNNRLKVITSEYGEFFMIQRHLLKGETFEDGKKYKVTIILEDG